jgi:hypothetical protein
MTHGLRVDRQTPVVPGMTTLARKGRKGVPMRFLYEPFVLRRVGDGHILFVSPRMPFEFFVHCFQAEQPFFLISQLEDGRLAITPNSLFFPLNMLQGNYGLMELLPNEIEYVTMRNSTYPLFITAHPVANVDEWFRKFERFVLPFAKQTLAEFVASGFEFQPLEFEQKTIKSKNRPQVAEALTR